MLVIELELNANNKILLKNGALSCRHEILNTELAKSNSASQVLLHSLRPLGPILIQKDIRCVPPCQTINGSRQLLAYTLCLNLFDRVQIRVESKNNCVRLRQPMKSLPLTAEECLFPINIFPSGHYKYGPEHIPCSSRGRREQAA